MERLTAAVSAAGYFAIKKLLFVFLVARLQGLDFAP